MVQIWYTCMVSPLSSQAKLILIFYIHYLYKYNDKYIYVDSVFTSENTRRYSSGGSSTYKP